MAPLYLHIPNGGRLKLQLRGPGYAAGRPVWAVARQGSPWLRIGVDELNSGDFAVGLQTSINDMKPA
jgi:hypothetical protein